MKPPSVPLTAAVSRPVWVYIPAAREVAASLRRAHFPKEAGALGTFSVYCSTENAVYTLTAKME
jgi:hypothetical protein